MTSITSDVLGNFWKCDLDTTKNWGIS